MGTSHEKQYEKLVCMMKNNGETELLQDKWAKCTINTNS